MKNLSISFTLGKACAVHGSNIQHNNRKFTAENVDPTRIAHNITYKQQYVEDAYNQLFGKALREYNAKQKKPCRMIDNYYAHIVHGHREEPYYEVIVQFGDCHTAASRTPDGDRVKEMLDEYIKSFQQRNPNLYVFNAVLHDDEASPHLHIDFIPFYTKGRSIGLSKGVSMRAALKEMGYVPKNSSVNQLVMWEESERKYMEELLHRHGYEREDKDAHYLHMTVDQYKSSQEAKRMTESLRASRSVSCFEDMSALKMQLAQTQHRADVLEAQQESPYMSFYYADDSKQTFVQDELRRRGIPFRETENGFEAQKCYVDEIRKVEDNYRRPKRAARDQLRDDVDKTLMQSKDFEEFLKRLEQLKYEVKRGKYIAVRPQFDANYIRLKSLGEFYSEDALRNRLSAKYEYERDLIRKLQEAKVNNAPNSRVLTIMHSYIVAFSKGYFPVHKKNPKGILTWKNDAELDRLLELNAKINNGATLNSLRADMAEKEQAVREIERSISGCGTSDPMVTDKLNIALQIAQQELKEAADWVTTAEQVLGGTYLQCIGDQERQRRESEYLYNGTKPADEGTQPETQIAVPHRRK
ncbi:MAG: plasmid recombination protein [Oscillospiraceae bacterium]|nr:plasmid recombination protein [Oscillospiraceae bacterium]MBR3448474.1 plasmid recombination protein [Oscillospiraceae bacterium]